MQHQFLLTAFEKENKQTKQKPVKFDIIFFFLYNKIERKL